jgi:hypothetical protein
LQFAQRDSFIFIKPPSCLRACETTDFVRDGLEARTEGFARIHALGDQLLIATTKTCIYVGEFFSILFLSNRLTQSCVDTYALREKVANRPDEGAEKNLAINPVQPFQTHFLDDRYFGAAESDQPFGPLSVAQR